MKLSLRELAVLLSVGDNPQTKLVAPGIYELYDDYFSALRESPIGTSRAGCRSGRVAEDLCELLRERQNHRHRQRGFCGLDFSSHPNVRFEVGDQRDAARLSEVCAAHAPDGLDIVIDDASHVGAWSLRLYRALFPFLRPGGFYMIEDWATGLLDRLARWGAVGGSRVVRAG